MFHFQIYIILSYKFGNETLKNGHKYVRQGRSESFHESDAASSAEKIKEFIQIFHFSLLFLCMLDCNGFCVVKVKGKNTYKERNGQKAE